LADDEVIDQAMGGALADADQPSNLGDSNLGILGDANENVTVVGEERPR
jgi:hypothetical protein